MWTQCGRGKSIESFGGGADLANAAAHVCYIGDHVPHCTSSAAEFLLCACNTSANRYRCSCQCQCHTHTRLTALCLGLPRWAGTRKVKPIWILLKQETVIGCGISWAICKSAPRTRQITMPAPHHSVLSFTCRMPFLPPNQQLQSTEGTNVNVNTRFI